MSHRIPAEAFPVGSFIKEEMDARGWDVEDVVLRMGGDQISGCALDFLLAEIPEIILDVETSQKLGKAFSVSPEFFLNLDRSYHDWRTHHVTD